MDEAHVDAETRKWGMFLHLGMLAGHVVPFAGFVVPIVIWQLKKDELPGIDAHGRIAVNWMISELVYLAIGALLLLVLVGFLVLPLVLLLGVVFPIVAAVKAGDGEVWRYPLSIRFLG